MEEIQGSIDEKKKEIYVVTEIEKLRVILNDILENVSSVFKKDFTDCKSMVNKNLTDISKAKVQQYDQATYDREIGLFKDDPMHKLITKGREELKNQYRRLKIANPCPWIGMDQREKLSVKNFHIEKIYTPLKIGASRAEISTENLLIAREVCKSKIVILYGLAGSGKTSLCLHYLHHWTEDTDKIETLKDYCLVIYVELRAVKSNTIEKYLKEQRMKNSTDCINEEDLVQQLNDLNVLFIVDGYDEAKEGSKRIVRDICSKFPNQLTLVTTRTELREEVKYMSTRVTCTYLKICGFDESRVKSFTEKVFDAVKQSDYYLETQAKTSREINSSEFLHYIQGRGKILEKHLELPLTLALMIYMWIDCEEVLNKVTTCTSLYYELYKLCQEKIKTRLRECKLDDLKNLLILLGKKGWQLLQNDEDLLSNEDVKEIDEECRKRKVPKEELLSAFLMYDVDPNSDESRYDYSFMHRTQKEYLSAYFLAKEAEKKNLNDVVGEISSHFHQIIIFLVGHFTLKKMLDKKMKEVFALLAKIQVEDDDFDFWWRLLTESQIDGEPSEKLSCEIIKNKLKKETWKLSSATAVPGLELLIHTPAQIKDLIIEIQNGEDPYDIRDFFIIMQSLGEKLRDRYHKKRPLLVELFFWQHYETRCKRPSNDLLQTLNPWGHLKDFAGSVGEYDDQFMLNFCFKLKNLRVRVETRDAQISLSKSLAKISKGGLRQVRVILDLDPEECNPETLDCLTCDAFQGKLELTLQHTEDKHKNWIVQVVKKVSGRHGCFKLILEKSILSFPTVKCIMEELRDVVREKYKVGSTNDLTDEQMNELEKLEKRFHAVVEWDT
ncbi:uncharacterized protein LOC127009613 [Eriocheir sinensis]|uniref:uncharacterized protein LOC127009613 n=1 Tax=Eriocheir sinensis TaxID=95602 RepID=UPI0021C9178C|nr:uncharacterized protein LOC127009613 [Eriocheir sinensis]